MAPRTMFSKFAGTCMTCRRPFPAGAAIEWAKGQGARHARPAECAAAAATPPPPRIDLSAIAAFLLAAQGRGLKYPKARFLAPDAPGGELRISISGPASKNPGAVQVHVRDRWVGYVKTTGDVIGSLSHDTEMLEYLLAIAHDPAYAAKCYGALMCQCSFCGLPLSDEGSVEVGYGPVCAKRWGLPHQPKGTPAVQAVA